MNREKTELGDTGTQDDAAQKENILIRAKYDLFYSESELLAEAGIFWIIFTRSIWV